MKIFTKTFTLIAFVCLVQAINAQTVNQGAWMIGGSAGLDIDNPKPDGFDTQTSWYLNPNLGYYIADDLAIGLALVVDEDGNDNTDTYLAVGPAIRYYVADPLFIQVGAYLELNEGGGTSFGAAVGYSWFLNNSVAIEPALYFNVYGNDGEAADGTNMGLSIGVQAFVGRN